MLSKYPESIAIAELCVYIPIFILTVIVMIRHGFQRQLGWIYLAIFCIIRLVGAGFKIESVHHPTNKTDTEWSAILQSVGLSPLLMASMGLLKRLLPGGVIGKIITNRATANSRRSRVIQIAQLPIMIALILCIVGGTDESGSSASDIATGKRDTKIGVVIFLIIYLLLIALAIITMKDVGNAPKGEKRVYFAVLGALPLLGVRLLWSLLSSFSSNPSFSITSGKPLVQFFMATLEEFVVVVFYTLAGLTIVP
ncbi:hypothetical protein OIDMADRAFT_41432 [Oidiodendron maius Zn]|uniref:DUF7702 domain-containing protein n=1 Tax=Oidiodendron maius (strain Zn) TaxID=913774 RepID=A0A0C3HGS1_OIDMZ|nr:hypothetical protein OIDMADRAFT_41432 [Oidiodendron maius Zn]